MIIVKAPRFKYELYGAYEYSQATGGDPTNSAPPMGVDSNDDSTTPKKKGRLGRILGAIGHGIVAGVKAIGHAIVVAEQFVVKESKVFAKGVAKAAKKVGAGVKKLVHHKDAKTGKDVFKNELPTISASEASQLPPDSTIKVGGVFVKKSDIDPSKPIVASTDPNTGAKKIGQDYEAHEVVGEAGDDGNVKYYSAKDVDKSGMSSNMKIALIGGGVLALAVGAYFIFRKKK